MPDVNLHPNIRLLTADDLGIGYAARARASQGSSAPDAPIVQSDDPRLLEVIRLLQIFGGVILSGPAGTGKSLLAGQVADQVTSHERDQRADIQFHASYQFEDFMEGYRPKKNAGGFEPREGVFLRLVRKAAADPNKNYVIVIDELSRADVGRVFGEALTYVERSKREMIFTLPSGDQCAIPRNIYVVATMNPLDRGVDEVDAAFERRFAKVTMPPDPARLEEILDKNGLDPDLRRRLLAWFRRINARAIQTPSASVGHAYFSSVVDDRSLRDLWDYQLKYLVHRAFQFDPDTQSEIVRGWDTIFESPVGAEAESTGSETSEE